MEVYFRSRREISRFSRRSTHSLFVSHSSAAEAAATIPSARQKA